MPSFDINAIIANALNAAVQEAIIPLVARIEAMEINIAMMQNSIDQKDTRIAALENNPAIGTAQGVEPPVVIDEAKMVEALNSQEWFWHKIAGFITNNSEITAHDLEVLKDHVNALEESKGLARDEVEALIERAMDLHLECYDHDNYDDIASRVDDMPDFDGFVAKDDLRSEIEDVLNNATFNLRF